VSGPGGHSWGAFGQPSAIHGLSRIVGRIAEIDVSGGPKTTYNVGRIEGGVSINTIAPSAEALIDMRSIDAAALQRLVDRVGTIASRAAGEGLETRVHVLGERPAGICPRTHPLVGAAGDALRAIGIEPIFDASSTDANVPISLGIPAICVGITRGGRGHTVDEYIETTPISDGLTQLASLTLRACELLASNWQ
jgi:acetylornithine deacetylase/succinyl-diaminopimelate desuccinylase-like protein